jgi:hypothetical protein
MEIAISRRNRNRLIASHAREDIEREVSQVLCPHRMEVAHRGPLNAELYGVALHQAMLLELHYGSETRIDAGDIGNHYLFRTTLSGQCALESGGERVSLRAGSLSVSSPARMSRIVTDRECRNLLLRIDRQALEVKLAEMLNDSVKQPLMFDLAFDNAHTGTTVFLSTLRYLCNLCDQFDEPAQERIFGRDLTQPPRRHCRSTCAARATISTPTSTSRCGWTPWRAPRVFRRARYRTASASSSTRRPGAISANGGSRPCTALYRRSLNGR